MAMSEVVDDDNDDYGDGDNGGVSSGDHRHEGRSRHSLHLVFLFFHFLFSSSRPSSNPLLLL